MTEYLKALKDWLDAQGSPDDAVERTQVAVGEFAAPAFTGEVINGRAIQGDYGILDAEYLDE